MQLNVGRIDFINTTPVYCGIDSGIVTVPGRTVNASPARLNLMLRSGELQISSVSSVEYAYSHPDLLILPGLSISCVGPVRSVLLYTKKPLAQVSGVLGLTNRSATARALVRIIMEDFLQRKVDYVDVDMDEVVCDLPLPSRTATPLITERLPRGLEGLLVIGDDALGLPLGRLFPHVLDLGEFWVDRTGDPFVFGLWAVRRDIATAHAGLIEDYRARLVQSLRYGVTEREATVRLAAARSGFSEETIRAYLERIDYGLGPRHIAGLERFFALLKGRDDIASDVALEFFETNETPPC